MAVSRKTRRELATGLAFLSPNIVGVLIFTVFPVVFAVVLALTDWDLTRHNMFKDESIHFVGLDNFMRLIFGSQENIERFYSIIMLHGDPQSGPDAPPLFNGDFLQYLGNTLFLMMGIPFSVGGSLLAAILLSKDTRGGGGRVYVWLIASALLLVGVVMLTVSGMGGTSMTILLVGVACAILLLGVTGGLTAYRTMFYMPYFTSGVATYLLWKKLYNPQTGPINTAIRPALDELATVVNATPAPLIRSWMWVGFALMLVLLAWGLAKLRRWWVDGEAGGGALVLPTVFLCLPILCAQVWGYTATHAWVLGGAALLVLAWQGWRIVSRGRDFKADVREGAGNALMLAIVVMVGQFILLGLSAVLWRLPSMASVEGLEPPGWIARYEWAKPSMMIIGFWAAIGSNNMLLYLAALSNVPQDLYEASDIDGAGKFAQFWNVTWPQLAPTTFFIAVMSTIGGLQGGFEMARVLTQGGPARSTTTMSYYIYQQGFETGQLGFAAAVSWALFLLVFVVTLFNWRFGNRYVND